MSQTFNSDQRPADQENILFKTYPSQDWIEGVYIEEEDLISYEDNEFVFRFEIYKWKKNNL